MKNLAGVKTKIDPELKIFGERLKHERERRMRQIDLAPKLGVRERTIAAWESGDRWPSGNHILKMQELGLVAPRFPENHRTAYDALAIVLENEGTDPACARAVNTIMNLAARHRASRR